MSKYDNDILEYYPETHTYWVNGRQVPSVTELVSIYNEDDSLYSDDMEETIAAATERGTVMHDYIARRLMGEDTADIEIPEEYWPYADGVEQFLEEHDLRPIFFETKCWAKVDGFTYAGTPDFYGIVDGAEAVLDWKFVSSIQKQKVAAQLGGYARMLAERDLEVWQAAAIQFLPGTYRMYKTDIHTMVELFNTCLDVAKLRNKRFKRSTLIMEAPDAGT